MKKPAVVSLPKPPRSVAGQAEFYRVTPRTIDRWRAREAPLLDVAAMIEWAPNQKSLPDSFLARIAELKAMQPGGKKTAMEGDADWQEFISQARSGDAKESLEKLALARDFASFKFEKASRATDKDNMKFYAELLSKFEGVFHDAQLRARKLGIDEGELLPRSEVERITWAVAYWLLRATDQHLDAITSKLKALSPGLDAEPVRAVLEPELLSCRFLEPFAKAARIQSGVGLPGWLFAKMRESAGDFLEAGEKQFDEVKP